MNMLPLTYFGQKRIETMSFSSAKNPGRLDSLQFLRGLAALLVAGFHLQQAGVDEAGYVGLFSVFQHGEAGVDLFFAISGFIILYTAAARPNQGGWVFLTARFWRIFPPYWATLVLFLLLQIGSVAFLGTGNLPDLRQLVVSVFLLPYPDFALVVAWTLSVELVFYLIFAASFLTSGLKTYFAAMTLWVGLSVLLLLQKSFDPSPLGFLLNTLSAEFLMGSIAAWLVLTEWARWRKTALVTGSLLLLAWLAEWTHDLPRVIGAGLPSALIVYGATGITRRMPDWVLLLGEASFLLYLLHIPVFLVVGKTMQIVLGINVYATTFWMMVLLLLAVVLSCAATLWIERPYRLWYRAILHRPSRIIRSEK